MSDLQKFHDAQAGTYKKALTEIKAGRKESHWMWYIFPQIAGLGMTVTANYYAIRDLDEAKSYLADETLRSRLIEISSALLDVSSNDALDVLGYPDNLKLRSSMTLFREADPSIDVFQKVLDKFYGGKADPRTLAILKKQASQL